MASHEFHYSGAEFEALSQADNYYAWIRSMFGARLHGRVVEVGAGRGNFSARLLEVEGIDELMLVEPDVRLHGELTERFRAEPRVRTHQGYFGDHDLGGPVDAIVLVNVLEHIEDDAALVHTAWEHLKPGGALLLFVPAGPSLFGSLDRAFDHFRRYEREQLRALLAAGGLQCADARYVNAPGAVVWFLAGRVFRQQTIRIAQMKLYDRLAIPLISRLESLLPPPRGQSLMAIAVKSGVER
jgi:SAM-dependent methyltransferase